MAKVLMTQAYDFSILLKRLEEKGLSVAEPLAKDLYEELKAWVVESAALSPTPYDNLIIPFINQLDVVILPQLDKIYDEPVPVVAAAKSVAPTAKA